MGRRELREPGVMRDGRVIEGGHVVEAVGMVEI